MKKVASLLLSCLIAANLFTVSPANVFATEKTQPTTSAEEKDKEKDKEEQDKDDKNKEEKDQKDKEEKDKEEKDKDKDKDKDKEEDKEKDKDKDKETSTGAITIRISDDISSFYVNKYDGKDKLLLKNLLFEPLISTNVNNQPTPGIIQKWEGNAKGNKYTLYLDEKAKWSDGTPITSKDVKYTLESIRDDKDQKGFQYLLKDIESVDVDGDYKAVINLKNSRYTFMYRFADLSLRVRNPKDSSDEITIGSDGKIEAITSGAFVIDSIEPGEKIVLKPNKEYGKEKPKASEIHLVVVPDHDIALDKFLNKEIDVYPDFADWQLKDIDNLSEYKYYSNNTLTSEVLIYNNGDSKFSDPNVRLGLSLLIDRQKINEEYFSGFQKVTEGFLLSDVDFGNDENYKVPDVNIEEGKKLLEKSGLKKDSDGYYLKGVEVITGEEYPHLEFAQAVVDQWNEAGVEATLKTVTDKEWENAISDGKYMVTVYAPYAGVDPYETDFLMYSGMDSNYARYSNKNLDGILDKAISTIKTDERKRYYKDAQEIISKEIPFFPLMRISNFVIYQSNVKGLPGEEAGSSLFDYSKVHK